MKFNIVGMQKILIMAVMSGDNMLLDCCMVYVFLFAKCDFCGQSLHKNKNFS